MRESSWHIRGLAVGPVPTQELKNCSGEGRAAASERALLPARKRSAGSLRCVILEAIEGELADLLSRTLKPQPDENGSISSPCAVASVSPSSLNPVCAQ